MQLRDLVTRDQYNQPTTCRAARWTASDVERRIRLAAQVSDAMFGLTREPRLLKLRLRELVQDLAELLADPDQVIRVEVECSGACPPSLHGVLLRVVQQLAGNAIKHGFYARLVGRIRVDVASSRSGTTLLIADDGWEACYRPNDGDGLRSVYSLIALLGGSIEVKSVYGVTVAAFLPSDAGEY